MRTTFSKRLVASGLIAAVGANLLATAPAFADSGRDGNAKRMDWRRDDNRRDWNRSRDNDNRGDNRGDSRRGDRGDDRGRDRHAARGPSHDRRPAVRVVERSTVVRREVRRQPVVKVVEKPVIVQREIVRRPAVTVVDYRDYRPSHVHYAPPTRVIVVPERRRYRNVWVVRHYGHRYHGYGHYIHDRDAYQWLAFTAVGVALIGALSEPQQRMYEDAQIRAAAAPVGQTIYWNDGAAAGTVTAVREGTSSQNRYCREFQQTVTVGGNTEQAYGTACRQPDGAWEIVPQPSF
jgi:hypothetical protein